MPAFSQSSSTKLDTCDPRLRRVAERVAEVWDCTVLAGRRGPEEQDRAHEEGNSGVRWPEGRHNCPDLGDYGRWRAGEIPRKMVREDVTRTARAIDIAPYPIDWRDRERFCLFAGLVLATARELGVRLRWGGDWNGNLKTSDENLSDLVHFELVD